MNLGVAISVYDKLEFVELNLKVFKNVWQNHPQVGICCNHKETYEKLKAHENEKIKVVLGEDYPVRSKQDLRKRQHDCIKKSITSCLNNTDYVIHWHADAFALSEQAVFDLVEKMKNENFDFAGRGFWESYKSSKVPDGDVDDHFFIVSSDVCKEKKIFSENNMGIIENLLRRGVCSEGILSHLVKKNISDDKILIYSDMSECEVLPTNKIDERYPDKITHRTLPPVNFDPTRKFLHCDQINLLEEYFKKAGVDYNKLV